jgi:hypothetical protein
MDPVEVWRHDTTGAYFLVGDDGATVFGPVPPHEVLRQFRLAVEPHESVLRIPCFYEVFATRSNPHALTAYTKLDVAWLPPSVTLDGLPDDLHAFITWQPPVRPERVDDALRAIGDAGHTIDARRVAVGRLTSRLAFHPKDSLVVAERTEPGARCWFVEWP